MQGALIPGRRTALCMALAALALPSQALDAGPVEVLSAIGERFDARIPLRASDGEWFHATCLALARDPAQATLPPLEGGVLSVERRRASTHVRVRTAQPVSEPAFAFALTTSCAGSTQPLGAGFTILLDPPRSARAPAVPGTHRRVAPATPPARATSAQPLLPAARLDAPSESAPTPAAAPRPAVQSRSEPAPPPATAPSGSRFVLRLSSAPMDLARSREFDDKGRALLRERLRLLDSDDQVAAMLAMRDNLRRLEARVAELQLKLAGMPQSFATAGPAKAPPADLVTAPASAAPAPRVAASAPTPPAAASAPATAPTPAAAAASAPVPAPTSAAVPAPTAPASPLPGTGVPAEPAKKAEQIVGALESLTGRMIAAGVALLVLLAMLAAWLWSRWRQPAAAQDEEVDASGQATVLMAPDEPADPEPPIDIAAAPRPELTSDAGLATRLDDNTDALRRRYIEERFPEVRGGTIQLQDPGSVVKGARLFYEDGAIPRAVELLRFAIEARPGELRPWLALFEIYRLERLAGEYAELAARFRDYHGGTGQWAKVRAFGRELDPSNPLYQDPPMASLETIGPRESRRLAAAATADPVAENWLEAPMDFENEVLASDLRRSLMARAGVEERDLVPNPMPALRSVEMFPVG